MDYDALLELADCDETQEEILQYINNLLLLLYVKEQLGDLVDISDRLFGYQIYCEEGNNPFLFSTISVIFSLPENLESRIYETIWTKEEWEAEGYPVVTWEEICSIYVPFDTDVFCQTEIEAGVVNALSPSSEYYACVKKDHFVIFYDIEEMPYSEEDIIPLCVSIRLALEGGVSNA